MTTRAFDAKPKSKLNCTVTYDIMPWPAQVKLGATPKRKVSRAYATAKRLHIWPHIYDRATGRCVDRHKPTHKHVIVNVVMDPAGRPALSADQRAELQAMDVPELHGNLNRRDPT